MGVRMLVGKMDILTRKLGRSKNQKYLENLKSAA